MFSFVWRQYPEDLTDPYFIRETVFMDEQGFSEEFDGTDSLALHLTLYLDGARAGCARLYEEEGGWHIGRVAVLKPFRGMGLINDNYLCILRQELGVTHKLILSY